MSIKILGRRLVLIVLFPYLLIGLSYVAAAEAKQFRIENFLVKENLIKNNKLAIIACDSNETPLDKINGVFAFTVNGFKQTLTFHDGVAIAPQEIDKSSFVFIKHQNQEGTHSKLYYVYKNDDGLKPLKINWVALLIVPFLILIIASIYKRLLFIAILALIALTYFNYSKGLSFEGIFETIQHGLRNIF